MHNCRVDCCERCGNKTVSTIVRDGEIICRECHLLEMGNHISYLMQEDPAMFFGLPKEKKQKKVK